ncbi:hypothetical protein BHK98_10000 [Hornefia porci]|uniref:Uncharacterized protein n=1 Tax=Hornefia porci TaxID=2652292 RepID=A0A1Q9JJI6_9FIRM|nr:hypothetical protein [Hornefia porci]OLR56370.1 hypothetical protein BHK98_10000 [Hornefia porci]
MLLILLGVVILVILVIAFMFNMKKSEARNDQILGDLNDSISELQNRMNTVEGDRSAVIEVVSPRDTVEETSDTGDWVSYSRAPADEPSKGRELQPEYAEQARRPKPEKRTKRKPDTAREPEQPRREADTDDFWSQFERSDSGTESGNMERQTMEGYTPAAPAGRNPDVDFGMSAGRHGTEGRSGSGQSPLDRQMEPRRGAHAAQSGGLLNSFGFGSRKDDTIVIEHRPEERWTEETEPQQSAQQYADSQRQPQPQTPQYDGQTMQQEQQYGQQQYGDSQRRPQPQAPQYGGQAVQQQSPQYGQRQYSGSQRQPQPQAPQYDGQTMQQQPAQYGQQQYSDSQRQPQPQTPQYGGQTMQQKSPQYGQQQYGDSQRQPQPQAPQYGGQAMQQQSPQYGQQQYSGSQRQPQPQTSQYSDRQQPQTPQYGEQQMQFRAPRYDGQPVQSQAPQYGGQPQSQTSQYGGQQVQPQDSQRPSSLAEQLQQATQRMQEMAQQARDAVPQMDNARKDLMGQRSQNAVRTPSAERAPDMTHRTARDTANHYVDRESGTDRQGRVYSVEQLNEQIK